MKFTPILTAAALALTASGAAAACAFQNDTPVRSLTAGFAAWKAVTEAMAECGNVQAELDQEFAKKQPAAFAANPALYQIGGVANETMVPLLNAGTIRPLDELVAKHGQQLTANQKITVDGKIMAVAMMVNAQHLIYREDILTELGIAPPTTYAEMLVAAEKIAASGKVKHPIGATMKAGWNVGQDFVNLFLGAGGSFFKDGAQPNVNTPAGVTALETMKALTAHMDPEFLVSDSTYVQKQFQQGDIAMANLWASRVGSLENPAESTVAGKIGVAAAPAVTAGGPAATTIWWDGIVIAKNISDAEAEAAFRVAMEGLDREMVTANNDAAVWLIDGYQVNDLSQGVIASLGARAPAYPASTEMGLMHTAIGNAVPDFLTGKTDAAATLAAIEAAYLVGAKEAGLVK
jgi:ABC-type glycerol-3-phosphate transport system substrate-binding protein